MNILVNLLIYVLVCGLIAFLIQQAPIDSRFKQIAVYAVLVVFVIMLILLVAGSSPVILVR